MPDSDYRSGGTFVKMFVRYTFFSNQSVRFFVIDTAQSIRLQLPARIAWAGLVQAAAEQAGNAFGLDSAKTLRLVHCAEELLLFLAAAEVDETEMTVRQISTGVEIGFLFVSAGVDLSALNLVSSPDTKGNEEDWTSLPLLLAARMSDGFRVGLEGRRMEIILQVDKVYPEPEPFPVDKVRVQGQPVFTGDVEAGVLLEACSFIAGLYAECVVPEWCSSPGRAADMIRAGELVAMEARDAAGRLCGIIFWKKRSDQSITFFGPYDFSVDGSVAAELVNAMLRAVGRTKARNVFSSLATRSLAEQGFEKLAEFPFSFEKYAPPVMHSVWGRMLQEDFGATSWTHEGFTDFLRSRYDELELLRDLRPAEEIGEAVQKSSVLGARLSPRLSEVFLYPELNGADIGENIARHVSSLVGAGYRNIFFEIDLSKRWHAAMGGHLLRSGFRPELMLPHGGLSDTLIFRYVAEA
ncbi:hypothetical protein [Maridesulfovibrio sp.]|uniref:hypothetical protein n=1 Tax=Maridesulfovibrio sp. TaxID=2795000 RepID=UPI002A188477|nr:hypothetical protein [Maridesulfovibrio sp.]